jgi:hypothetical protein
MTKKILSVLVIVTTLMIGLCIRPSFAAFYKFSPTPQNLFNLAHAEYYSWRINWTPEKDEKIVWAKLIIKNINNWQDENDILYIHLLKRAPLGTNGVKVFIDNQAEGDNFSNWKSPNFLLDTYTDENDAPGPAETYTYRFKRRDLRRFNRYVRKRNHFGLGFDPDCHYWNDGIKLKFRTVTAEPTTILLFGTVIFSLIGVTKMTSRDTRKHLTTTSLSSL